MNVLLINPPCRAGYLIPLGLGYIASIARAEGHNVHILDINAFEYSNKEVEGFVRTLEFDVVGIGGLTTTYKYVKWLAGTIKAHRPHVPIAAGNMVSTAHPELLLRNSKVDIAVIDEGETTFKELLAAIKTNQGLSKINGIFYKDNGAIVKTAPRQRISDLDSLPFPAWDLFPMDRYLHNPILLDTVAISAGRGCPYECTFCSRPFGRRVFYRSAKSIIGEIKELKKRYRIKSTGFSDDLFLVNRNIVLEFCDRMISEKLDVKWCASARVNLVDDKLLRIMRKAGCVSLGFGFESGSQSVLNRMKKGVSVKQAKEAIRVTKRAGIRITGSFIFGMPGETRDTIRDTLNFIKKTRPPIYRFFYATPYPNTELYEIAKRMGRLPADEDKYVESLGEMNRTFLVNLTEFSDEELVRLKNLTEVIAKKSLGLGFWIGEFMQDWERRYNSVSLNIKKSGISYTLKAILRKILRKLMEIRNPRLAKGGRL
jgi:anaerobic magnesium-protoporphyrin IX monomethyl ester cyclase